MNSPTRLALTLLALGLAAVACGEPSPRSASAAPATRTHEGPMQPATATTRSLPPIDLEAPAQYQTATFALG